MKTKFPISMFRERLLKFLDYLLEPFLETIKKYYRIERKEICFLKFIFEAYDGIAMLTTVDSDLGVVMFHIAPGCEDDVEMILQDLQHHIMIERYRLSDK